MHIAGHRVDVGALIFGAILLLVGGYYLLVNTFGIQLPELDWDQIWPIPVIVLGIAVVARALQSRSDPEKP
jgi:hypothetical protein